MFYLNLYKIKSVFTLFFLFVLKYKQENLSKATTKQKKLLVLAFFSDMLIIDDETLNTTIIKNTLSLYNFENFYHADIYCNILLF